MLLALATATLLAAPVTAADLEVTVSGPGSEFPFSVTLHGAEAGPLPGLYLPAERGEPVLVMFYVSTAEGGDGGAAIRVDTEFFDVVKDARGRMTLERTAAPGMVLQPGEPTTVRQGDIVRIPRTRPPIFADRTWQLTLTWHEDAPADPGNPAHSAEEAPPSPADLPAVPVSP